MTSEPKHFKVDVAFLGARRGYNLPRLLFSAGLLGTFYTDIYLGNKPWLQSIMRRLPDRLLPAGLIRLRGRQTADLPPSTVVSFDTIGLRVAWRRFRARSWKESQINRVMLGREFCKRVASRGFNGSAAVYCFKGGGLEIFREAKRRGLLCFMEQNSAAERIMDRLLRQEAERWEGWEPGMKFDAGDPARFPMTQREEAEWALADVIFCPSEFVASGLQSLGVSPEKCRVVPYGIDLNRFRLAGGDGRAGNAKGGALNVLFVGHVSVRKGVPALLEGLRRLNSTHIRCRLVGSVNLDPRRLAQYTDLVEVMGAVPRAHIGEHYRWADVLVFPSACESFGLVTCEAFAAGVPVIATPNSGSIVTDGVDGFIVSVGDSASIAERLERLASDRELLRSMSARALERSREFDTSSYGRRLLQTIHTFRQPVS